MPLSWENERVIDSLAWPTTYRLELLRVETMKLEEIEWELLVTLTTLGHILREFPELTKT